MAHSHQTEDDPLVETQSTVLRKKVKDPNISKCSLCYEKKNKDEFVSLSCAHAFCRTCVDTYFYYHQKSQVSQLIQQNVKVTLPSVLPCPNCRKETRWNAPQNSSTSRLSRIASFQHTIQQQQSHRQSVQEPEILQRKSGWQSMWELFKSTLWIRLNTSPCPKCSAPTLREGVRRFIVCSVCGHNWCWNCRKPLHRNLPCNPKEKHRNLYLACLFLLSVQLCTLIYQTPTILEYFGKAHYYQLMSEASNYTLHSISTLYSATKHMVSNYISRHELIFSVTKSCFFITAQLPWYFLQISWNVLLYLVCLCCELNTIVIKWSAWLLWHCGTFVMYLLYHGGHFTIWAAGYLLSTLLWLCGICWDLVAGVM